MGEHDIRYRQMPIREFDGQARTFDGIAVPYGQDYSLFGFRERFEPGEHYLDQNAAVYAAHGHLRGSLPIGGLTESWSDADGFHVRGRLSETPAGDEAYTLLRDGTVKGLSIGFTPETVEYEDDGDTTVIRKARIRDVSLTGIPAYDDAKVEAVRERNPHDKGDQMDPDQVRQIITDTTGGSMDEMNQRVAVLEANQPDPDAGPLVSQYRDGGMLLKGLAAGEDAARRELADADRLATRAADTTPPATSGQAGADAKSAWIDRPLRFKRVYRKLLNFFDQGTLPDFGNTVEFPQVGSTAGSVGKQANEGDALSYMEVELTTGSATVGTYGGYSQLTRQAIERGDPSYLNGVFRFQALQYMKATETMVRSTLTGLSGTGSVTSGAALGSMKANHWIDTVVEAAASIADNSLGLDADAMVVSRDVFKALAHLTDADGRPIFAVPGGNGVNVLGTTSPLTPAFTVAGLPGIVDPNLSSGTAYVLASDALTVLESAGAPFRLSDQDIVNLTRAFSLYGYAAVTVNDKAGVVKVTFGTGGGGTP